LGEKHNENTIEGSTAPTSQVEPGTGLMDISGTGLMDISGTGLMDISGTELMDISGTGLMDISSISSVLTYLFITLASTLTYINTLN